MLIESSGGEQVVKSFPSRKLPKEPQQRFAALFRARALWRAKDLNPFLQDMLVANLTEENSEIETLAWKCVTASIGRLKMLSRSKRKKKAFLSFHLIIMAC